MAFAAAGHRAAEPAGRKQSSQESWPAVKTLGPLLYAEYTIFSPEKMDVTVIQMRYHYPNSVRLICRGWRLGFYIPLQAKVSQTGLDSDFRCSGCTMQGTSKLL